MLSGIRDNVHLDKWRLTPHVANLESSIIREILKITTRPGIISFAGGLPAPELFPMETIKEIACQVIDEVGPPAIQYSLTSGLTPFRELLAERATMRGTKSGVDNILITAGAQQGIELLGRAFIEPGDYVIVESPTFVSALQVFNYYQARYLPVEMDNDGMKIDQIEDYLKKYRPKLIYTISNFQNPTGITMSTERRVELVRLASEHNIPIVDDNPYGELRFSDKTLPTLKSLGGDEVVALRTFSKLISPGFRIGWMNGPASIISQFEKVKQSIDMHANTFGQHILYQFVKQGYLEPHLEIVRADYQRKRDRMLKMLKETFPPEISWTHPEGGMFLWLTLPEHMSAKELLPKAIEQHVAYVFGSPFYANGGGENKLRLNFSNTTLESIVTGIERLAVLFKANM